MKRKRMEIELPEAMIQRIQSIRTAEEAARTALVSKSWYAAWLARPTLEFDQHRFIHRVWRPFEFLDSVMETLQRYAQSNLNIQSFTLRTQNLSIGSPSVLDDLTHLASAAVVAAVKLGATDLDLDPVLDYSPIFVLPEELLRSDTLVRLSLRDCKIEGKLVKWPNLKSLKLDGRVRSINGKIYDAIGDILSSCCVSIEDLSLSGHTLCLIEKNLCRFHKLRRLSLTEGVFVDASFFDEFDSLFPCLEDLSLDSYRGYSETISFSSASLQRMSFSCESMGEAFEFHLNLPNLSYFSYKGAVTVPSITIEAAKAKEWESHIHIEWCSSCDDFSSPWYRKLKKLILNELSTSRIMNLSLLDIEIGCKTRISEDGIIIGEEEAAVVVENLTIESEACDRGYTVLFDLFTICRPKFVAHYWLPDQWGDNKNNDSLQKLMQQVREHKSIFEVVKVDVYEEDDSNLDDWRCLVLEEPLDFEVAPPRKRKVRLQLKWR